MDKTNCGLKNKQEQEIVINFISSQKKINDTINGLNKENSKKKKDRNNYGMKNNNFNNQQKHDLTKTTKNNFDKVKKSKKIPNELSIDLSDFDTGTDIKNTQLIQLKRPMKTAKNKTLNKSQNLYDHKNNRKKEEKIKRNLTPLKKSVNKYNKLLNINLNKSAETKSKTKNKNIKNDDLKREILIINDTNEIDLESKNIEITNLKNQLKELEDKYNKLLEENDKIQTQLTTYKDNFNKNLQIKTKENEINIFPHLENRENNPMDIMNNVEYRISSEQINKISYLIIKYLQINNIKPAEFYLNEINKNTIKTINDVSSLFISKFNLDKDSNCAINLYLNSISYNEEKKTNEISLLKTNIFKEFSKECNNKLYYSTEDPEQLKEIKKNLFNDLIGKCDKIDIFNQGYISFDIFNVIVYPFFSDSTITKSHYDYFIYVMKYFYSNNSINMSIFNLNYRALLKLMNKYEKMEQCSACHKKNNEDKGNFNMLKNNESNNISESDDSDGENNNKKNDFNNIIYERKEEDDKSGSNSDS